MRSKKCVTGPIKSIQIFPSIKNMETYQQWHQAYSSGITTYYLTKRASNYSFESFTGINDPSSQKLEGIDEGLMKDLKLTNQFLHLYRHTDFALTDFIFVRDFYSEINVEIIK